MSDLTQIKVTIVVQVKVDNESLPSVIIELSFGKVVEILRCMPIRTLISSAIVDNVLLNITLQHQRSKIVIESKVYALDAQNACLYSLHNIVEPD